MDLSDSLKEFVYLDKDKYCCTDPEQKLSPMFNDIKIYDYVAGIQKLAEYYGGNNYYKNIYEKYKSHAFQHPLYLNNYDYDLDEIFLQYIKNFPKASIIIFWPNSKMYNIQILKKSPFYNKLSSSLKIHAIKELDLTRKQVQGVIYQLYYNDPKYKEFCNIKTKQDSIGATINNNKIFIVYCENDNTLKSISNNTLHISTNFNEIVELSELFCNKNSMRLLQYQRLDRLLSNHFYKSLMMLMTFKKWLYTKILLVDHIRFMLFSSIVIYSLGLRDMNDIDLLIYYFPADKNVMTKNFLELVDKLTFPFIETTIKKDDQWYAGTEIQEYKKEWFDKEWPALYNAESMDDTFLNPRFHYYYFGIKVISMIADFKRRIHRSRPAAFADLIAVIKFTNQKIDIPKLPSGYWKNHVYYDYTQQEINVLYKKIKWYLKKRYDIFIDINNIKSFIKT